MALNPPVSMAGVPLRVADEFILLERDGTEIEVKVNGMKTLSSKGKIFLTSARLVYVSAKYASEYFKSFDLPLALMKNLDFKQPVFGSNYLELTIMPLYGLIPSPGIVKIWFTKGGCDKFLRIFDVAKAQVATQLKQGRTAHDNDFNQRIRNGFFANNAAYQDPNDPSYVYVQQPPNTFQNTDQYLGDQTYYNNMHGQGSQPGQQGGAQSGQQPPLPPGFLSESQQPPKEHAKQGNQHSPQTQTQPLPNEQQGHVQPQQNPYQQQNPFQGQGVSIGSLL